jgi:predicted aldo/keto reductase-like oxidoreductase
MRYCSFPKIPGLPISALGFGCMRLPTADQCTECADCEPKCPQNIPIIEMLAKAHAHLT